MFWGRVVGQNSLSCRSEDDFLLNRGLSRAGILRRQHRQSQTFVSRSIATVVAASYDLGALLRGKLGSPADERPALQIRHRLRLDPGLLLSRLPHASAR